MSSYLNIYLVPKRKDKKQKKQHLLLLQYSRNNDVYEAFYENINPVYSGNREAYTPITKVNIQEVIDDLNESIESTKERLGLYEQYAKDNPDYIQDIIGTREVLRDYTNTLNTVSVIKDLVEDIINGYNDFEEICCNID